MGRNKIIVSQMSTPAVQTYGRKKTSIAVAHCKTDSGLIKINGQPIETIVNETHRMKVLEPVLLLGVSRYNKLDIRVRVSGGGYTSQIYAIRQALAKSIVAFYQKNVDEVSKQEIKDLLVSYDRSLLVADCRRREAKKY